MKMLTAFRLVWLSLTLCVAAPAAAAPNRAAERLPDRFDCRLMDGLQCRSESRDRLLAFYGLPTAESRLAAGSEMYRVFVFDAWMGHHVAITVERSPGSSPTLTLHAPPQPERRGAGSQTVPPVSVPMSVDAWYLVRRRGSLFERRMVPEPVEPGVIRICGGHGPLYFVESTNPEPDAAQPLRRSGLGHCVEGLADAFGIEVALLAAEIIPSCAILDDTLFLFTAERLRACAIISGDRIAAAEVYNLLGPLLAEGRDRPSADRLASLFDAAEVGGSGVADGARPEQAWLQALAGETRTEFVVEEVHARDAGHVVVDGLLRRRHLLEDERDETRYRVEEAPVQLVWTRSLSDFEIERLTIGAYEPAPDRCSGPSRTRRSADC